MKFFDKVLLPQSPEEFDSLVDRVVKKFNLKDKHHAAAIISVAIRHIPNEQAHTTIKYLGHYVQKNIANYVANYKSNQLQHEAQVTQLENMLKADPGNLQARDELQKAAGEGSTAAKTALARIYPEDTPPDNVIGMK
jgi:hypothetical protein